MRIKICESCGNMYGNIGDKKYGFQKPDEEIVNCPVCKSPKYVEWHHP